MIRPIVFALGLLAAIPASAQVPIPQTEDQEPVAQPLPPLRPTQPGRVAESTVGVAGQRQTREDAGMRLPMARIGSRISNRVQSRLRNRIDRNYDPQANATDLFAIAEDQTRIASRRR